MMASLVFLMLLLLSASYPSPHSSEPSEDLQLILSTHITLQDAITPIFQRPSNTRIVTRLFRDCAPVAFRVIAMIPIATMEVVVSIIISSRSTCSRDRSCAWILHIKSIAQMWDATMHNDINFYQEIKLYFYWYT